MTPWTDEQLAASERVEELEIVTARPDGTPRRPVPIWVVRVGNGVNVRSYRGEAGVWYRHARTDGAGRVQLAGLNQPVTFDQSPTGMRPRPTTRHTPPSTRGTATAISSSWSGRPPGRRRCASHASNE